MSHSLVSCIYTILWQNVVLLCRCCLSIYTTIYSFVKFSLFPSFVQSNNLHQVFLLICYIVTLSNQVRDHISKWIIYCQNILTLYNILLQFMTWSVPNQGLLITPRLTVSCRPPVSLKYLLLYIICIDSVYIK